MNVKILNFIAFISTHFLCTSIHLKEKKQVDLQAIRKNQGGAKVIQNK